MRYLRLRDDNKDDTEYDIIVIFEKDYKDERIEDAMRELWNSQKRVNIETWLKYRGFKIKDVVTLNDIDVMYLR